MEKKYNCRSGGDKSDVGENTPPFDKFGERDGDNEERFGIFKGGDIVDEREGKQSK